VQAGDGSANGRRGLVAGLLFGIAIATKANALLGVVGAMAAIAVVDARSSQVRRSLGGALLGLAVAAAVWIAVVLLPAHDAVLLDTQIWPHESLPGSVVALVERVASYPFRSDGALPALLPLVTAAGLGIVLTFSRRRTQAPTTQRLAVAAIGWIAVELGVLVVVSYRPNRYLLPILPAAAILVGIAAHALWARRVPGLIPARLRRALAAAAVGVLTVPGLVAYSGWMARATYDLGPMQATVAAILRPGATVWGGFGPLVALRAPVTTIVPWPDAPANVGPAYRRRPVRWVVDGNHVPSWIVPGSAAWATRQQRACFAWDGAPVCLYELP
jgi:hypothetical protein